MARHPSVLGLLAVLLGLCMPAAGAGVGGVSAAVSGAVSGTGAATLPAADPSAWPWAFALLAVAAVAAVGWLAWRLGQAQGLATAGHARGHAPTANTGAAHAGGPEAAPPPTVLPATRAAGPAPEDTPAALAALAQALDLHDGPGLLWNETAEGPPQLGHLNAAARALWPHARPGDTPAALQAAVGGGALATDAALPPSPDPAASLAPWLEQLQAGLHGAAASQAGTALGDAPGGWRAARIALAPAGPAAWVLMRPAMSAGVPADAESSHETEQFSFTLSHDLRAPIRVVEGFTRIVKEDYGGLLDRVGNDHLDRVLGAAARMNQMIDALLTLARLSRQPLSRQPVNLSQLASWVADELRRTAPERAVRFEIEPGLQATGDPTLLRMVLENLLGNAWKYSGRNELSVIRFDALPHGDDRAYRVQDNGAGFDMRGADRLFGLFQRLHSASEFPGTGVGLASVRRIVQRHGGQIWAEAEPGRGASFHFTLAGG